MALKNNSTEFNINDNNNLWLILKYLLINSAFIIIT